jgi:hypothetical protein
MVLLASLASLISGAAAQACSTDMIAAKMAEGAIESLYPKEPISALDLRDRAWSEDGKSIVYTYVARDYATFRAVFTVRVDADCRNAAVREQD